MSLNPVFNPYVLRRLYDSDRRDAGVRRERVHTTITPETFAVFTSNVPFKKGGFGGAITELSYRMMLSAIGALSVETVGAELSLATYDERKGVAARLYALASFVDQYEAKPE